MKEVYIINAIGYSILTVSIIAFKLGFMIDIKLIVSTLKFVVNDVQYNKYSYKKIVHDIQFLNKRRTETKSFSWCTW